MSQNEQGNQSPMCDVEDLRRENLRLLSDNRRLQTELGDNTDAANMSQLFLGLSQFMQNAQKTPARPVSSPNPTQSKNDSLPDYLLTLRLSAKTDNYGSEIDPDICEALRACWHVPFHNEEILELLEGQYRPENATALKPLIVNDDVKMSKPDLLKEKEWCYIGNAICAAGKGLAYLLDMLVNAETEVRAIVPADKGIIHHDDFEFDLPHARDMLLKSLKILGIANIQTGQARHTLLLPKFKPDYQKLCDTSHPFVDGKFFGPSFSATAALIRDVNTVHRATFQAPCCAAQPRRRWSRGYNHYMANSFQAAAAQQQAMFSNQGQLWQNPGLPQQQHQLVNTAAASNPGTFAVNQYPVQPPLPLPLPGMQQFRGRGRRSQCGRGYRR